MNNDRKRAALDVTIERMNAEREAMGLPAGYRVATNEQGVPFLACVDVASGAATPQAPIKRVSL